MLTRRDEPECTDHARMTIIDATGDSARACPQHAVAPLGSISGTRADWADTRGITQFERTTLEPTEEINARPPLPVDPPALHREAA